MTAKATSSIGPAATELWRSLCIEGGIEPHGRDLDLAGMIRQELINLGCMPEAKMELMLEKDVTPELLLVALFRGAQPFSVIFGEIIEFLRDAGATEGKDALELPFDFKTAKTLGLNLEAFRHFKEVVEIVDQSIGVYQWNHNTIWILKQIVAGQDSMRKGERTGSWFDEYERGNWPAEPGMFEKCGFSDLDPLLSEVYRVWRSFLVACRKAASDRNELRRRWLATLRDELKDRRWNGWPIELLGLADSDRWPAVTLDALLTLPERLGENDAKEVADKLRDLFASLPRDAVQVQELRRMALEFLRLPVWRHRYELYSIWIGIRMERCVPELGAVVHVESGKLAFPFRPTLVATFATANPGLEHWCELYAPLTGATGKGRSAGVQPDHNITNESTNPAATTLVVECKHYAKSSRKHFVAALTDYAKGFANATVLLVNYGPVSPSVLSGVHTGLRSRVRAIGNCNPAFPSNLDQMRDLVRATLRPYFPPRPSLKAAPNGMSSGAIIATITLEWNGKTAADLDLYLVDETDVHNVSYREMGSLDAPPFARLVADRRNGDPPEVIEISHWDEHSYLIKVHAYNASQPLGACEAKVTFMHEGQRTEFNCPLGGMGDWWHVFRFQPTTGEIQELRELRNL